MIVLIDDMRMFQDDRDYMLFKTSQAAIAWLLENKDQRIDELWLDHDLGLASKDDIGAVVAVLEEAAFLEHPYDIGIVYAHSANPAGREMVKRSMERYGYKVQEVIDGDFTTFRPDW